jgi:hypothetical protein
MRLARLLAAGMVLCLALPGRTHAQYPLELIHESADVLIEVPNVPRLVGLLSNLELLRQLDIFPPYREFLESTPLRRGQQLLAYLEKQLGASRGSLLQRLTGGGGILIASKFGPQPAPTVVIVRGCDDELMTRFFDVALEVIDQELARQEGKQRIVRGDYHGVPTAHAGNDFWTARASLNLIISNKEQALHAALDRQLGRETKSLADNKQIDEAWRLLPKGCQARAWINLDAAHKAAESRGLYKTPRDDANLTVLFGSYLDLAGRSPFVCLGLAPQDDGFLFTIRAPRGRDGMGDDRILHLAPKGKVASRPLLEPKGVLYSEANYLDFASIWSERTKLFPEKQVKGLEEFDKTSARFLLGNSVSKLLPQIAPYYRFVAVQQGKTAYKKEPQQHIPAFAIVSELREPEAFGKSMEGILRAAALLAGFNVKLKLAEETYKDCKIIGWRFPDDAIVKVDNTEFRFNFSPCFTRVGNQFVYCSTIELCRELVELLQKEGKEKDAGAATCPHAKVYAAGGAELLESFRDQLITQTILDQAAKPDDAGTQVKAFIDLVRRLGTLELAATMGEKEFHYDVRLKTTR